MQSKSVVLNMALIAAVLATLQSAAALASNPTNPAEQRADREYKVAIQRFFKEIFGS